MAMARRDWSPQTRTLAALLTRPSPRLAKGLDTDLLWAADAHGVTPLLGESLRIAGLLDVVAPDVLARLNRTRREAIAIDAVTGAHTRRTLANLADEGVEAIVFKGAALAQTHYASSWLRPRGDVDLLVRPSQVAAAGAVLERNGCGKASRPEGTLVTFQSRYIGMAASMEVAYDLHWRLADPHAFDAVLDHATITAAAVDGESPGERFAAPVDALIIACVHRVAHHHDTDRLLFLCDIDRLARRFSIADWERFAGEAVRAGISAVCLRGLDLAATLLNTPIPVSVKATLAATGDTEPTAWFADGGLRRVDILCSDVSALGWRRGARLIREHVFPPRAYISASYQTDRRLLLPLLYAHRLVGGLSGWLRRPGHSDPQLPS
jgi:hypothetical protein